jgi:hypothetical protein
MSEAEKLKAAAAKLQKLASRLNRGWDMQHPVKEKHLEKVREAVRAEWAEKQKKGHKQNVTRKTEKPKRHTSESSQQKSATKKKSKSQSKDHGHSH